MRQRISPIIEDLIRGDTFVPLKITRAVDAGGLSLRHGHNRGDLLAEARWAGIRNRVESARLVVEQLRADCVLATGSTHSVGKFVVRASAHIGKTDILARQRRRGAGLRRAVAPCAPCNRSKIVSANRSRFARRRLLVPSARLVWCRRASFEESVSKIVGADRRHVRTAVSTHEFLRPRSEA